jgi:hypothetical protein
LDRRVVYWSACILSAVAVFPLPYGFYTFLRLVVTGSAVLAALELNGNRNSVWVFFAGIAILFNPIFPIFLSKATWFFIDLGVAGAFGWIASQQKTVSE